MERRFSYVTTIVTGVKGSNSGGRGASQEESFRSAVSELSTGGSLLVVSEGPARVHRECCRQLLGNSRGRRFRVLGMAGSSDDTDPWDVVDRLPDRAGMSAEELRVVHNDLPTRGGAAARSADGTVETGPRPGDASGGSVGNPSETVEVLSNATLGEFGLAIDEAIDDLIGDGDPDDGQLRVCIDDVATLVDVDDAATVAQFLHVMGTRVESAGGILHAHASMRVDTEAVRTLVPFVDGVVHLRLRDEVVEMRWIMSDGPASEWFPLDLITP